MGRRDVRFWEGLARRVHGPVLELGCGTGRLALPVGRAAERLVGIDRSEPMLARARQRVRRAKLAARVHLIRGDIRHLPFPRPSPFGLVMAPYGMLQSLLREADLEGHARRRGRACSARAQSSAWTSWRTCRPGRSTGAKRA